MTEERGVSPFRVFGQPKMFALVLLGFSSGLPLLLTKTDVDKGVDETNYAEWLAERGETA